MKEKKLQKLLDKSIEQASVIIFVTGAGGALGQVLKDSGAGSVIAMLCLIQTSWYSLPFSWPIYLGLLQVCNSWYANSRFNDRSYYT